jgi:hypothetical protein
MYLHDANASWLTAWMGDTVGVGVSVYDLCEWAGWFKSTDEELQVVIIQQIQANNDGEKLSEQTIPVFFLFSERQPLL